MGRGAGERFPDSISTAAPEWNLVWCEGNASGIEGVSPEDISEGRDEVHQNSGRKDSKKGVKIWMRFERLL